LATNRPQSKSGLREQQGLLKPGGPAPFGTARKPLIGAPATQPCRPRPWNRPSGPRKKQLEGSHGDRQAARADALGGEALAVNDALRIGGYLLWGLAGLVLAMASKGCFVDPVLPSLCLGLLVAYLCYRYLGQGQADQQAAGSLFGWQVTVKGAFVIIALSSFLLWWALSNGKDCVGNLSFKIEEQAAKGKLQAETSTVPQRLVGYVDGTALSKAVGELVNSDYFHPVLSEMRKPLFCANKASCAQNAGFYLQAIASAGVPRGHLELCDDPIVGAQARELVEMVDSGELRSLRVRRDGASNPDGDLGLTLVTGRQSERSGACELAFFSPNPSSSNHTPIRVFALMHRLDLAQLATAGSSPEAWAADSVPPGNRPQHSGPLTLKAFRLSQAAAPPPSRAQPSR